MRRSTIGWARPVGAVLAIVHLAVVGWLALRPLTAPWVAAGNFVPLHTIHADLALGPAVAMRQLSGGLLLLAPLGVLLPMAGGRLSVPPVGSFARTVFTGLMISFGLQVTRGGQLFDVDMVLLNTAGVALAYLAVVPAVRALLRHRRRAEDAARAAGEPAAPGLREGTRSLITAHH